LVRIHYFRCSGTRYDPAARLPALPTPNFRLCAEVYHTNQWPNVLPTARDALAVAFADPADGTDRLFVALKHGEVRVLERSSGRQLSLFLTVPGVHNQGEAGLLGIAFHPQYAQNGRFFTVRVPLVNFKFSWN
jgi:hypothetical protein